MKALLRSIPKFAWYIVVALVLTAAVTLYFVLTKPANTLRIAAGEPGSYYYMIAQIYKEDLAKEGVDLEIIQTKGAAENLALVNEGKADIALSHGGVTTKSQSPDLISLGSISYQPLWVFTRAGAKPLSDFSQLKGLKIATGLEGSGVAILAKNVLRAEGIDDSNTTILHEDMLVAEKQLKDGQIDAAIFMDPPEAKNIKGFFNSNQITEVSLKDAEALRRHFRFLHVTHIPPSGIDLASEQPHEELLTISPTAYVAVSKHFDPALQYLLLSIMDKVHHEPTLINDEDEFPSDKDVDLKLSSDAEVYYKKGKPFLQEYLPFQIASLVERLIKVLLPLLLVVFPIFAYAPQIYNWHMHNKILRRYESLVDIEKELADPNSTKTAKEYEAMIHEAERKLNNENIPVSFSNEVYILREHIELVHRKIAKHMDKSSS